jgi:transposase-like protein
MRVELRRRGLSRWPEEVQRQCAQLLAEGIFKGAELSQVMGVGQQTLYNWRHKQNLVNFKSRITEPSRRALFIRVLAMDEKTNRLSDAVMASITKGEPIWVRMIFVLGFCHVYHR